jgi:tetratricopeptide (TPR) repeat protein
LTRNATNIYGFAHTSKECVQQLNFISGRKIPRDLELYLSAEGAISPRANRRRTDLYLVEISSTKEIVFGEWYLQINYFERSFQGRRQLYDAFFKLKDERDQQKRVSYLETIEGFAESAGIEREILTTGYVHQTTLAELEADMATLNAQLDAPVVFVSHINVPSVTGALIETRARLCQWIRDICAAKGYTYFDPTPHVQSYGVTSALAEKGLDLNHYTPEFKQHLGALIFDTYCASTPPQGERQAKDEAPVEPQLFALPDAAAAPIQAQAPRETIVSAEVQATIADAKRRMAEGDLDEAEAILRGLMLEDNGSAVLHTMLGSIAFQRGDTSSAAAQLQQAIQLDPAAIEPRLILVRIALRMGKLSEACSIAIGLAGQAPDNLRVLMIAAKAMMKAKRFSEATVFWRRVASLRPELTLPVIEEGRCQLKSRNYEEALAAADKALGQEPNEPTALVIKSEALQRLKRMSELAEVSIKLAAIDPGAAMAAVPALISTFHPEEAAKVIAVARRSGDGHIETVMKAGLVRTLETRAKVADERGDARASAAAWKAVLLIEPENQRAQAKLRRLVNPFVAKARAHAAAGETSDAVASYCAALELQDDNARALRELAGVHEKAEEWLLASDCWSRLADLVEGGEQAQHLMRAGRSAARAERYDLAVKLYSRVERDEQLVKTIESVIRKLVKSMRDDFEAEDVDEAARKARVVLQIDPDREAAQRVLHKVASSYVRQLRAAISAEDLPKQEAISCKMLVAAPGRTLGLKTLARLYRKSNRYRDSIAIYERLTEIEPNESSHWIKLARSCRAVRMYDRGVPAALKALEMKPADPITFSLLSDMLNRQAAN